MTWIAPFSTSFVEPIIDNLLTYIRSNALDALTWANGGVALPDFAAIYDSRVGLSQDDFPNLMVDRVFSTLAEDDHESSVEQLHKITLIFELVGTDATELTARQKRYMKALDSMCRKIPQAVLMTGVEGTQHCGKDVINHDYGVDHPFNDGHHRLGTLTFVVEMTEYETAIDTVLDDEGRPVLSDP